MENYKDFEFVDKYIKRLKKDNLWHDAKDLPEVYIPVQVELFREGTGYFWSTGQYEGYWSLMRKFLDYIVYDPIDEDFWTVVRWRNLPHERNQK
jgi:hypothetical protein